MRLNHTQTLFFISSFTWILFLTVIRSPPENTHQGNFVFGPLKDLASPGLPWLSDSHFLCHLTRIIDDLWHLLTPGNSQNVYPLLFLLLKKFFRLIFFVLFFWFTTLPLNDTRQPQQKKNIHMYTHIYVYICKLV